MKSQNSCLIRQHDITIQRDIIIAHVANQSNPKPLFSTPDLNFHFEFHHFVVFGKDTNLWTITSLTILGTAVSLGITWGRLWLKHHYKIQ